MTFTVTTDEWKSDAVDYRYRLGGQTRPFDRKLHIRRSGHLKKDSKERDFNKGHRRRDLRRALRARSREGTKLLKKVFREEGKQEKRNDGTEIQTRMVRE